MGSLFLFFKLKNVNSFCGSNFSLYFCKQKKKEMKREFDDIKTPADESFEWYFINWLKSSGIAFAIAGLLLVLEICADCIDIKLVLGVFAFVWFGLLCLFVFRAFLGWLVAFVCGMDIE